MAITNVPLEGSGEETTRAVCNKDIQLTIEGMSCAACAMRIEKGLKKLPGVQEAAVNLATEQASVIYDPEQTSIEAMEKKVEALGYKATPLLVEEAQPEVGQAEDVGVEAGAEVQGDGYELRKETVSSVARDDEWRQRKEAVPSVVRVDGRRQRKEAVSSFVQGDGRRQRKEAALLRRRAMLILGVVLTLPVVVLSMFFMNSFPGENYLLLLLSTPVWLIVGWDFHRNALKALRHGGATMDTLVSLGSTASYLLSAAATFFPHLINTMTTYDSTALIVTLITLGKYLEARARGQANEAISKLAGLQARVAHVIRNGQEVDVPIEQVRVGDELLVKPGEKVPVDGVVISGVSAVDESMMTGESIPVDKSADAPLLGATINQRGVLRMRATRVGADTMLAQIIRAVEQAQGSKAPIQRLADHISGIFVPVVLVISVLTFIGWAILGQVNPGLATVGMRMGGGFLMDMSGYNPWISALIAAVSVLVVACPCALGLATPTAIIIGTGKGAEQGILIKGGESLERIQAIRSLLLDKTGTITRGKPEVTDVLVTAGMEENELLRLVALAEQGSEHPLASAIITAARMRGIPLNNAIAKATALPGHGLEAEVEGHTLLIGTSRLLDERSIAWSGVKEQGERLQSEGKTVMLVAYDERAVGLIAVADRVKVGSAEAIAQLQQQGLDVFMVTGDNKRAATAIAQQVAIAPDHVFAEVLPEGKGEAVKRLQQLNGPVAFAGDGINDAPALAQADASIAMGTGTAIAMETADITLVKGNLRSLVTALELSRATMRVIRQNLFWAFGYNIVLIPIAILSPLIPFLGEQMPVFAAAAMALSSVTVVSNSLRLRTFRSTRDQADEHPHMLTSAKQWAPLLVGLTLVLLALLPVIIGTLRYTTLRPSASQTQGTQHHFVATRQTGDGKLSVTLTITPDRFGPNTFTVAVPEAQSAQVQKVFLDTTMLDMDMGTDTIALASDSHGEWRTTGSLSMTGDWRVRVVVHTVDGGIHSATFTLTNQ